jgi:hypothetical protein
MTFQEKDWMKHTDDPRAYDVAFASGPTGTAMGFRRLPVGSKVLFAAAVTLDPVTGQIGFAAAGEKIEAESDLSSAAKGRIVETIIDALASRLRFNFGGVVAVELSDEDGDDAAPSGMCGL